MTARSEPAPTPWQCPACPVITTAPECPSCGRHRGRVYSGTDMPSADLVGAGLVGTPKPPFPWWSWVLWGLLILAPVVLAAGLSLGLAG